ncbi:S8 family serine peptidase [Rhizobium azibense]|uniref:Subtilase family protein n=1 Tax=Rhizobium azibense TaxID=1136135 RepID=A0A4R3RE07_9HYPH|nr:S8 family serine peptidase [Rhizobium azibense]TCU33131.1 subtilase family protein [Rhizobium azibense]
MVKHIDIKLGGSTATLSRSDVLVALKPEPGHSRSFEAEVNSIELRGRGARRGTVGGYHVIELPSAPMKRRAACEDLGRMVSMQRQVAVYHTSEDNVPFVPTGTIYMSFREGTDQASVNLILQEHSLVVVKAERGGFITVGTRADPVEACSVLQSNPAVAVAEPDLVTPKQPANILLPEDRLFGRHWHLNNIGKHDGQTTGLKAGADARVVEAWYALGSLGSDSVVIGIVDDGFDLSHPYLRGKALLSWDFERNAPDVGPIDMAAGSRDWHGTACAGVAAGRVDAGDIVGAAPHARIMPARMGSDIDSEKLARIFDYMTDNGAWVVNCSWGPKAARYPIGQRVSDAISRCIREGRGGLGIPVLFAAGNRNTSINDETNFNGLAAHPDVVVVSSSTSLDQRSDTSNYGSEIWLCAPSSGGGGWTIVTDSWTDAAGTGRPRGYSSGDYHECFGGTSSSCALVSGVCALVLSAAPRLSAAELRAILQRTARRIGDAGAYVPDGHSIHFGFGCVDAAAAVAAARASLSS